MVKPTMLVRKVKVSWLATSIIAPEFGASRFATKRDQYEAWSAPESCDLAGLTWTDPWRDARGQDVEPERSVCREMLEGTRLTDDRKDAFLRMLFRNAMPLRAAVRTVEPNDLMAEVFLFPWGASGVVTATFDLEPPEALMDAAATVDEYAEAARLQAQPFVSHPTTGTEFVARLARSVACKLQSDPTRDPTLELGSYVIATPIDGVIDEPRRVPVDDPDFAYAMDRLAGQSIGLPFRWLKVSCYGQPGCIPTDIRRILSTGMSQWVQPALCTRPRSGALRTTLGAHRNAVLRWARLTALHGELTAEWRGPIPTHFQTQLRDHRLLLGRLFGAVGSAPDWIAQRYVLEQKIGHLLVDPNPKNNNPGLCPPDED